MKKVVIITGANSGIGKAAAYKFTENGYTVVMACRNLLLSEPVRSDIRTQTGNPDVHLLPLDISSRQSIYHFCNVFKEKYNILDILIHNAGHFKHGEKSFQQSIDGWELTHATNLFGPVLMNRLLLDVLSNSMEPRILNACSTNIKHFFDGRRSIDLKTLDGQSIPGKSYDSYKIYGDSKMGLMMATSIMAEEYSRSGICINAIMIPATKMSKETIRKFKSYWKLLAVLQNTFIPKAEVIGDAYFSICTSGRYKGITGKLINHRGQIVRIADESMPFLKIMSSLEVYPPYANDEETSRYVWEACNRYIAGNTSTSKPTISPSSCSSFT